MLPVPCVTCLGELGDTKNDAAGKQICGTYETLFRGTSIGLVIGEIRNKCYSLLTPRLVIMITWPWPVRFWQQSSEHLDDHQVRLWLQMFCCGHAVFTQGEKGTTVVAIFVAFSVVLHAAEFARQAAASKNYSKRGLA